MEATGSSGASGRCSGSLLSQRQGTHRDSLFPAGCTGSFKTCLCRLSKNCPDWSCHCSLSLSRLLEGAASKSKPTFKSVAGTACSWILPAQSHLPAISPMHPGHLKVKGRQGCLSPSSVLERAALPVLKQVPATEQNSVPFDIKPSHTHSTARQQQIVCPGQLKKESSSLIFYRQGAPRQRLKGTPSA